MMRSRSSSRGPETEGPYASRGAQWSSWFDRYTAHSRMQLLVSIQPSSSRFRHREPKSDDVSTQFAGRARSMRSTSRFVVEPSAFPGRVSVPWASVCASASSVARSVTSRRYTSATMRSHLRRSCLRSGSLSASSACVSTMMTTLLGARSMMASTQREMLRAAASTVASGPASAQTRYRLLSSKKQECRWWYWACPAKSHSWNLMGTGASSFM
mmetsp:Transcript_11491/g.34882  ORF Transcript_11491/g.34882 Transcript_11491/m.34882 type:complete len:213 (+) Transcript_11491:1819-2457(+)